MSDTQGRFCWYDLITSDVKKAIAFYGDVVGWGTQAFGDGYTMWTVDGTQVGGVVNHREGDPTGNAPRWMAHVAVDDVDALTTKAESLGATTLVPPQDIPTVGRFSVIRDPQRAMIALFTPLDASKGAPRPSEPANGHMSWHELMADDLEAAFRFYAQLFGWQKMDAVPSPHGPYQMYGQHGQMYGGMGTRPKGSSDAPHWLYYTKVADLDASLARVKKGGGLVLNGPVPVPGGSRIAQCQDPQGALFALHGA